MAGKRTEASSKPTHKPGMQSYEGLRPLIILVGYAISALVYWLAIRTSSLLAICPLCMLAFLIPDLMAIRLLGSPHPMMERLLLNLVGPWSTAIVLISMFDKTTVYKYRNGY